MNYLGVIFIVGHGLECGVHERIRALVDRTGRGHPGCYRPSRSPAGSLRPTLRFPQSSDVRASRHGNMRELRIQASGDPYRIFYAFDPRRVAILLIGGSKAGETQFYERMIPLADRLYDQHLEELDRTDQATGEEEESWHGKKL